MYLWPQIWLFLVTMFDFRGITILLNLFGWRSWFSWLLVYINMCANKLPDFHTCLKWRCIHTGFFPTNKAAVCWFRSPDPKFKLVGGSNPSEKYWSNWILSPTRGENKQYLEPPPSLNMFETKHLRGWIHGFSRIWPTPASSGPKDSQGTTRFSWSLFFGGWTTWKPNGVSFRFQLELLDQPLGEPPQPLGSSYNHS